MEKIINGIQVKLLKGDCISCAFSESINCLAAGNACFGDNAAYAWIKLEEPNQEDPNNVDSN